MTNGVHSPRFGAWLKFQLPEAEFNYHAGSRPINTAHLRELADLMDRKDEFRQQVAAINDKKDGPMMITVDLSRDTAQASIETRSNGKDALAQNSGESLGDFVNRTLSTAVAKAATLLSFQEKQDQQKARLNQVVLDVFSALGSGTFEKVEDVKNGSSSDSVSIRARTGQREYTVTQMANYATQKEYAIEFKENDQRYSVHLSVEGGELPKGLTSGQAPKAEALKYLSLQQISLKPPYENQQYQVPDKIDGNTLPEEALKLLTLRDQAKNIVLTLARSDFFPKKPY